MGRPLLQVGVNNVRLYSACVSLVPAWERVPDTHTSFSFPPKFCKANCIFFLSHFLHRIPIANIFLKKKRRRKRRRRQATARNLAEGRRFGHLQVGTSLAVAGGVADGADADSPGRRVIDQGQEGLNFHLFPPQISLGRPLVARSRDARARFLEEPPSKVGNRVSQDDDDGLGGKSRGKKLSAVTERNATE